MDKQPVENDEKKDRYPLTIIGLILAFVPSALLLTLKEGGKIAVTAACFFSFICCFTSGFILIRRNTAWSILLGALFLIVNLMISLFLGCVVAFWQ